MSDIVGHVDYQECRVITFEKVKERKRFLRDMACMSMAVAMIETQLRGHSFGDDLKVLHQNKNRKEAKKGFSLLEILRSKYTDILEMLEHKDIVAINGLASKIFPSYMREAEKVKHSISLSHVALFMVSDLYDRPDVFFMLKTFTKAWGIKRVTKLLQETGITASGQEQDFAIKLADLFRKI